MDEVTFDNKYLKAIGLTEDTFIGANESTIAWCCGGAASGANSELQAMRSERDDGGVLQVFSKIWGSLAKRLLSEFLEINATSNENTARQWVQGTSETAFK